MIHSKAYEEGGNFIALGTSPETVIAFRPSKATQARGSALLDKEKHQHLTQEEQQEFEHYLMIEHLMRLAKARARQLLQR